MTATSAGSQPRYVLEMRNISKSFPGVKALSNVTFNVKPGSRLYFKHPGGVETDITAKVGKTGKVTLPTAIKEGQKFIYARAMKDRVNRFIRINIFTNEVQDIPQREY